jgi:hypothetical protein
VYVICLLLTLPFSNPTSSVQSILLSAIVHRTTLNSCRGVPRGAAAWGVWHYWGLYHNALSGGSVLGPGRKMRWE